MRSRRPTTLAALCVAALFAANAPAQVAPPEAQPDAAAQPKQQPSTDGLVVYDLVVMQADHYGNTMNDTGDFESTLFNNAPRRRPVSDNPLDTPMPLGIITLDGRIDEPTTIQLELASEMGRFLGHWPKGTAGSRLLIWHNIKEVANPAGRARVDPEHWLSPLRNATDALSYNARGQIDRFFAYDATFPFEPSIKIEGSSDEGYTITGEPAAGTQRLLVVRLVDGQWLAGSKDAHNLTGPIDLAPVADPDEAAALLLDELRERGYNESMLDTAAAMLRETAFGDASMSLIYLVDQATLDGILPLTVTPTPAAIQRAGIVVINNVEPDIAGTVGALIDQLGADEWSRRNAAQRALVEMDRASIELVRANANHADPEVAYRIEQIIAAYEKRHP